MATAQRVFYETIAVLVFVVLLVAAWVLSGQRSERQLASAREAQSRELATRAEQHRAALDQAGAERSAAAAAHRRREAEAIWRGYAAGLQPAAIEGWRRYLGASREQLTATDPRVTFVHLVDPRGVVMTSTDSELAARGRLDENGAWVLEATAVTSRDGDRGTLELAGPILAGDRPVAYLWLGYDVTPNR